MYALDMRIHREDNGEILPGEYQVIKFRFDEVPDILEAIYDNPEQALGNARLWATMEISKPNPYSFMVMAGRDDGLPVELARFIN